MLARTWRGLRGESVDADVELDITYSKRAIEPARQARRRGGRQAARSTPPSTSRAATSRRSRPRTAAGCWPSSSSAQVRTRLLDVGDVKTVRAQTQGRQAEGHDRGAGREVPGDPVRQPRDFQLDALQGPQAGQDLRDRGRPGRPRDARRALPHPEQGGDPAWTCRTPPGSAPADRGTVVPGGVPENPLKARWLGHLRRRRHPRHRRRRLDRHAPRRTAASGCGSPR